MDRGAARIRTTHVGSMVRPPALVALLRAMREGKPYDAARLQGTMQQAINDVVERQIAIGLDLVNDGEYSKTLSWSRYVLERLAGFHNDDINRFTLASSIRGKDRRDFAEFYAEIDQAQTSPGMTGWQVTGPVSYRPDAVRRDIAMLKAALGPRPAASAFMCAVAPASVVPEHIKGHYRREEDLLMAVARALHDEYKAIVDAGFVLQIDDAYLATYYDMMVPPQTLADYRKWAGLRVDALNLALDGIPEERTRYHVCWGSWNGPHVSDVPFKEIADLVLGVRVGGYSLEMANPRHEHEWRVWETVKLPPGKMLLPGVVTHSTNIVEHPELVAERIVRLAHLVGREHVIASTDCGFAQNPFIARTHPTIMWAKLEALVEGARLASKTLWG